jgi:hypothetical protein
MRNMSKMIIVLLIGLLCMAGCAKPTAKPTANPDADLLVGQWEQFIPIESMPAEITMESAGSATVDGTSSRWRLDGGKLFIRHGSQEDQYSYTVSGYMMTLFDVQTETSEFYINPETFTSGADKNQELAGQWAAWSTYAKMSFDGGTEMDNIVYTTAGRADLTQKYAARDGILQGVDASGNYTYNLYSFSNEGALLLAETTDYDSETKQWTAYWKKTAPDANMVAAWSMVIDSDPTNTTAPIALKLNKDGTASATMKGSVPTNIKWEYYNGGFVIIEYSDTNLQYAWSGVQGSALNLSNPDTEDAWYVDTTRYKPTAAPLQAIQGQWKLEDSKMMLDFKANGTLTATNDAGTVTTLSATAADGMLKLESGGKTYYMQYSVDGDTMKVYYGQLSFLDQKEMPVSLVKS